MYICSKRYQSKVIQEENNEDSEEDSFDKTPAMSLSSPEPEVKDPDSLLAFQAKQSHRVPVQKTVLYHSLPDLCSPDVHLK